MFDAISMTPPRESVKWCACALALLVPGSFVVLPLLWLGRQLASRSAQPKTLRYAQHSSMLMRGGAPTDVA